MKVGNRIWYYILVFLITVISIYIYSTFVFQCTNETGIFLLLTHLLGLFFTGLMCVASLFTLFISYYLIFWLVNDDVKALLNNFLREENKDEFKPIICFIFIIGSCLIGYLIGGNFMFACN